MDKPSKECSLWVAGLLYGSQQHLSPLQQGGMTITGIYVQTGKLGVKKLGDGFYWLYCMML